MTDGVTTPDLAGFVAARRAAPVVSVTRRLLADAETPVGVYRKLAGERAGTFLLESAEHGRVWSRYSFVGARCEALLTVDDAGAAVWRGTPLPGGALPADPLAAVREVAARLRTAPAAGAPPLTAGLVGYVGYDVVRRLERLPSHAVDDLALPEVALLLASDLAVLDHADGSVLLLANVLPGGEDAAAYADALARLDAMTADLAKPAEPTVATLQRPGPVEFRSRTPDGAYRRAVERAKEYIRAGDIFQVVPSQRFEARTTAAALDVYRVLRTTNPSPYMYLLRLPGGVDVVGSSPEAHVKVTGRRAMLHPIAGTKPRGGSPEEDAALAGELRRDPKERAEHVMLVDLGRNDLGRVCRPGTVDVVEFMAVERYSHVMHLVSTVVGELLAGAGPVDVLAATFPAGTLSGAPKVRAMEIIDELEPVRRGLYGGTVGYLDFAGDLDMAIAIRTALLRGGTAYVQAGGGVVADSDPASEEQESRNKAAAVLHAIAAAETLRPAR